MAAASSTSCRPCRWFFVGVVFLQWGVLLYLLSSREILVSETNPVAASLLCAAQASSSSCREEESPPRIMFADVPMYANTTEKWEGVALGLMLRRPLWFYKRYNVMIHNALSNIPLTWGMQLMVSRKFFETQLLEYHHGLRRFLRENPRVVVTELPDHISGKKPNVVLRDRWVWEHVVADKVLVFHGDGTLCANSQKYWTDLEHLDYVGVPWSRFDGVGGDGTTHSFRNRHAMLAALDSGKQGRERKEDAFFVSTLLQLNQENEKSGFSQQRRFVLATPEESNWFGGTANLMSGENGTIPDDMAGKWGPLVVSGTQAHLSDQARNWVIGTCPEIKMIFPSLHHPDCFGARPNPAGCAAFLNFPPPCEEGQKTE